MNHVKTYIVHYAAIAAGLCALLAQFAPAVMGPQGAAIASAAAIGVSVAHALGIQPAQIIKATPALLLAALLPLGGCATLQSWLGSPVGQAAVVAAVDVAVATAEQKGVSAAEINGIAHQALAADQGASASLAAIAGVVNAQLGKLKLPAGDLAAAQVLEVALEAAIEQKIGQNPTVAQTQTAVAAVLQEVITASGG